jgi:hypothetical protein
MRRMTALKDHERRITTLEEIATSHSETLSKLHRRCVRTDIRLAKVLDRLNVADVTEDEIDAAMDEE